MSVGRRPIGNARASRASRNAKLHAMLTDYSPLDVALFTERAAAAKWLGVPLEALMVQR